MKKICVLMLLVFTCFACEKEVRLIFSEEVLDEKYLDLNEEAISLRDILKKHQGKQILIDVWASWCRDCIVGLPELEALQKERPEVVYLFLSADRSIGSWKRAIEKHNINGEHYFLSEGTKGLLGKYVDIDWIPRYMVVDGDGNIKVFEAIVADDPQLRNALK